MPWSDLELRGAGISATLLSSVALRLPFQNPDERLHNIRTRPFIFLCAGYSTHKRFVLGGEECAAPFACKTLVSSKTLVAYCADGCSPIDKGEIGPSN